MGLYNIEEVLDTLVMLEEIKRQFDSVIGKPSSKDLKMLETVLSKFDITAASEVERFVYSISKLNGSEDAKLLIITDFIKTLMQKMGEVEGHDENCSYTCENGECSCGDNCKTASDLCMHKGDIWSGHKEKMEPKSKYERPSKDDYYLNIAEQVAARSTCIRRKYGAVLIKNDRIVSTGYNGSPRGDINCCDSGYCERERCNIPKGERYELCRAIHAEDNAITNAGRDQAIGSTLYITGIDVKSGKLANPTPCLMCARKIKNNGIVRIVGRFEDELGKRYIQEITI